MKNLMKLDENVILSLRQLYRGYGYSQFKMSKFEPYDLYMQNKEFLVSDGVITFTDTDGTLMALKPDVTLSIVKNYRKDQSPLQKVCYNESVYRIAGAGKTYREIMQTGLECLGNVGTYEISEVLCLAIKSLQTITDKFMLDLSHMGIVSKLLSELKLSDETASEVLRYLGEKNKDAVAALLDNDSASRLTALMDICGPIDEVLPQLTRSFSCEAVYQLTVLHGVLKACGLSQYVYLDFSIVSDRNYYNGFVFRGYVEGIPTAILAGGQYDKLMEKMNKQAKGVGFAVYLDQLELLDNRKAKYDIDTVLLYDENADLVSLAVAAQELSREGVLLLKQLPPHLRYRKLMRSENGRLILVEENS